MASREKKDLCISTLANSNTKDLGGCLGVSIFPECTRCSLSYLNLSNLNKKKGPPNKTTATQK
jgi:hypothetical protein